jgi:carbamoyl-phosphate synthase large subunit
MKAVTVLVTGLGSTTALSVIKGLRQQKEFSVFIIGVDINEFDNIAGSHFCDRYIKVPLATDVDEFIHVLLEIVHSENVDLFIPILDIELEIIAAHRELFEASTYLLLAPTDAILTCNDKLRTYEFFAFEGIPTLKSVIPYDINNIQRFLKNSQIDFPFIAKPRAGVSSRDVFEIRSKEELGLIIRIRDPIIQEKGFGTEYTIDTFSDGQRLISAVPRKRIETRSGISYKGQTERNGVLTEYAAMISDKLHIKGPANIQCFKNDDEIRFFEINPRFSGSLPLTIAAGVNPALFALRLCAGQVLDPVNEFKIVKMCRYWDEVFYGRT